MASIAVIVPIASQLSDSGNAWAVKVRRFSTGCITPRTAALRGAPDTR
jgi:hypothetical protein